MADYLFPTYEADMKRLAQMALKKVLKRMVDPWAMKRMDLVPGRLVEREGVCPPCRRFSG